MTNNTRAQALANLQRLGQEHDAAGGWTPGPWRQCLDGHGGRSIEQDRPNGKQVCCIIRANEGDAALLGAAPDLYTELSRLVTALEPLERDGGWPLDSAGVATLNGARAALAKARGERG